MNVARLVLASAALVLASSTAPVRAEQPATTLATLLDKQQIEEMLVDYYAQLGSGRHDFGAFFLADGVIDVNGIVAKGQQEIEGLYKKLADNTPRRPGTFRMLLSNVKVVVNGNTATADCVWTGINSETVSAAPTFVEQGREHDELVKRDGRWYFKHRVITSDGGLPAMFEKTYKKR
jgi:SnoaL-like domain